MTGTGTQVVQSNVQVRWTILDLNLHEVEKVHCFIIGNQSCIVTYLCR